MLKCKVSIIVPIYNAEKYLNICIDSLINQDYKNIEIILIDDGSTDRSANICDEYLKKDNRIKVIHNSNKGVSATRNEGIKVAIGEWITFVDADDWVEKNYISSMYNVVDDDTDMIIGRTISVIKGKRVYDGYRGEDIEFFENENKYKLFESIFDDNISNMKYPHISTCSAKLFRMKLIKDLDLLYNSNLKYYEDAIFNMEVIFNAKKVILINKKIYYYRYNIDSATSTYNQSIINNYENVYQEFKSFSEKYNVNFNKYDEIFKIKNLNTILMNYCKTKEKYFSKRKFIKEICNNKTYNKAIKYVKIQKLPKRRKVLVILARLRMYLSIVLIYNL